MELRRPPAGRRLIEVRPVSIYESFGVRPVVNGSGPVTRLGGLVLAPAVVEAMAEASRHCVSIDELQEAAGRLIAEVTGAEDGYVTNGASAGIALAVAACMTGLDPVLINALPDTTGMRAEVVMLRAHRYDYDHAARAVGARIVEVGYPDLVHPYELDAAIGPDTAAVLFFPTPSRPGLPVEEVVSIAHGRGVAVIVDAAVELPPASNLRSYVDAGADLVVFSGGKAIGGPQASGIVCGRRDLVLAIALHNQDMDVRPQTWARRSWIEAGLLPGPPHHGIGRSFKVGKEEIVGLMVALREYRARDHRADQDRWRSRLEVVVRALDGVPGVAVTIEAAGPGRMPFAHVRLESASGAAAFAVLDRLQSGDPPVYLIEEHAWRGVIAINPMALSDEEAALVGERLRALLAGPT